MNGKSQLSVAGVPDGSSGSQAPSAPHTNPGAHSDVSPTRQHSSPTVGATVQEVVGSMIMSPTPK